MVKDELRLVVGLLCPAPFQTVATIGTVLCEPLRLAPLSNLNNTVEGLILDPLLEHTRYSREHSLEDSLGF